MQIRKEDNQLPFQYAIVLTKTDFIKKGNIQHIITKIEQETKSLGEYLNQPIIPIIPTSVVNKLGRDGVWKLLQSVLSNKTL